MEGALLEQIGSTLVQRQVKILEEAVTVNRADGAAVKGDTAPASRVFPLHSTVLTDLTPAGKHLGFSLAANGLTVSLLAPTTELKAEWWQALKDAVLAHVPADVQMVSGWEHEVVRGTLNASAREGALPAVTQWCRYTARGRDAAAAVATNPGRRKDSDDELPSSASLGPLPPDAPEVDVNEQDSEGITPLLWATSAGAGHEDVMALLLEHGADVNAVDADYFTPLHVALAHRQYGAARMLLANSADTTAASLLEETPLSLLLKNGDYSGMGGMLGLLLTYGADANAPDGDGLPPLHRVALLSSQAAAHCESPGEAAAASASLEKLPAVLVRKGADPAVMAAVRLPDSPVDAPLESYSALHLAVGAPIDSGSSSGSGSAQADVAMVRTLLAAGVPPNARSAIGGATVLHLLLRRMIALQQAMTASAVGEGGSSGGEGGDPGAEYAALLLAAYNMLQFGARLDVADSAGVLCAALAGQLGIAAKLEHCAGQYSSRASPQPAAAAHIARATTGPQSLIKLREAARSGDSGQTKRSGAGARVEALFGKLRMPDTASGACVPCGAAFSLLKRRHHCRGCGVLACDNCTRKTFPMTRQMVSGEDSDDDDAADRRAGAGSSGGAGAGAGAALKAGLAALLKAPQAGSSNPSTASATGPAPGSESVSGVTYERVCDSCFNRLSTIAEAVAAEADAWQAEKARALAAAPARNFDVKKPTPANTAAQREELFKGAKGAAAASSTAARGGGGSGAPPSATQQTGQKMSGLQATLSETQNRLAERGEKLGRLDEKMRDMSARAADFASAAEQLKKKSRGPFSFF